MTITVLRHVGVRCPAVRIKNLIDDISLHVVGGRSTVTREMSWAFKSITELLQAKRLPLSWDKMGFLCSDSEVFGELEVQFKECWPSDVPFPGRGEFHRDLGWGRL